MSAPILFFIHYVYCLRIDGSLINQVPFALVSGNVASKWSLCRPPHSNDKFIDQNSEQPGRTTGSSAACMVSSCLPIVRCYGATTGEGLHLVRCDFLLQWYCEVVTHVSGAFGHERGIEF